MNGGMQIKQTVVTVTVQFPDELESRRISMLSNSGPRWQGSVRAEYAEIG